jgi:adenylate cyclase, class 2
MATRKSTNEIEIKLFVGNVPALRHRLREIRAREVSSRTHEFNTLYDTPQKTLFRQGKLIRIRIDRPARKGAKASRVTLTFKGPPKPTSSGQKTTPRYKIREELETTLPSAGPFERLLEALGLRPSFRYEKFRTTYVLPRISGVKIEFDETPAGNFLELEGSPSAIDRAAKQLGYAPSDYSTRTYGEIHIEKSRLRGRKPSDMLFRIKNLR